MEGPNLWVDKMTYPFVNFAIGKALNKEWEDCGTASKPGSLASYGDVRSGINLSSDNYTNSQTESYRNFSSATDLNSWSLQVRFMIDSSPDAEITFMRCHREDYADDVTELRVSAGLLIVTHCIKSTNIKKIAYHDIGDATGGRVLTLEVRCNENSGVFESFLDGIPADRIDSVAKGVTYQFFGVYPGVLKIGNLDGDNDTNRGNVVLFDFRFAPNTFMTINAGTDTTTGNHIANNLNVGSHPSAISFDGELVYVSPAVEVTGGRGNIRYSFNEGDSKAIVVTIPEHGQGLTYQGKFSLSHNGSTINEYGFDPTSPAPKVQVNYGFSAGKYRITSSNALFSSALFSNNPSAGIEVIDFEIPSSNFNDIEISHNLGVKPMAGIFIDKFGVKHFFSKKSNMLKPIKQSYNGQDYDFSGYCSFSLESATEDKIIWSGSRKFIDVPNRRIPNFKSPGILKPFNDGTHDYILIASQPTLEYETNLYGQSPSIEIWRITSTGITRTGVLNNDDHAKQIKFVSILNNGSSTVQAVFMVKQTGWVNTSAGITDMNTYKLNNGTFTYVDGKTLYWHSWLDFSAPQTNANSRQLLNAETVKTTAGIFTVTLDSSNPPSTSTGGGGWVPDPPGADDPFRPDQLNNRITDIDHETGQLVARRADRAFSPAGATSKPVDFYITSHTGITTAGINIGDSQSYRKTRIQLRGGTKYTYVSSNLCLVPLEGSSYVLVNLHITVDGDDDIFEQFLLDNTGQLLPCGSSGVQSLALFSAQPGFIKGLNVSGENFVLESSYSSTSNVNQTSGLRLFRAKFTGKNGRSETRVRKELLASVDTASTQTSCDIIYFDNRIWVLSAPYSVGASQEIEIFTYDAAENKFVPIQSIPTWAYLKQYYPYGINGWYRPQFIISNGKLMIAALGINENAVGGNDVYNNYVFEWNPRAGAFVEPELFVTLDHGMRAGKGKLVLFAPTDSVVEEADIPCRSSRMRLTTEPAEMTTIDLPWREWPLLAIDNRQQAGATHICDLDFADKEIIPIMHGRNAYSFSAISDGGAVFMSCYDRNNNKTRAGEFGMFNREEERVPFYFNPSAAANNKTIGDNAVTCMFRAFQDDSPSVFTSNYSGVNGTCAISKLAPNTSTVVGWQELSGITGKVIKAKSVALRNVNLTREMVAVGFSTNVSGWNACVLVAGFNNTGPEWMGAAFKNEAGGKVIDFDIVGSNHSDRRVIGAVVTDNGYIQIYRTFGSTGGGYSPDITTLPGTIATNIFGGTFNKFTSCRVWNDGESTWIYGMANGTGEHHTKKGYVLAWRYDKDSDRIVFLGHKPWMHCVQLADRPFQYKGEWYWYALGISDVTRTYPISDLSAEQTLMVLKWNKELECFTSSRFWSEKRPIHLTFPRFPNRTGKYRIHPTIGILSRNPSITSAMSGLLNYDKSIADQDEWRFLHQPHLTGLVKASDGLYYYGDTYSENTCGNSSFGKGGNDFVLSIGTGDGFANPMTGFTVDTRWTSIEHPFVFNYNDHHFPMAVAHCATDNSSDVIDDNKIGAIVTNGGTYLRGHPWVPRANKLSFITPVVIPSVNRKPTGKFYVECIFRTTDVAYDNIHAAFYLEGPNGEKFAVIRNSTDSSWTTSGYTRLEAGLSLSAAPKNAVIGLVFDYDDNRLEVYINGTYRSQKALPSYDMRIRGMMVRTQAASSNGGIIINFGQVAFERQVSGTQKICGPTLGGHYPLNYTNNNVIDTKHYNGAARTSSSYLTLNEEPGVIFINSNRGSYVLTQESDWKTLLDLDGTSAAIKTADPVVTYRAGSARIYNDRWASGAFDGSFTGIVVKPCYGIHVETVIGSGVPGTREFNVDLPKRPSACLILSHQAGQPSWWVFYDGSNQYFVRADDNQGYSTSGWETTRPMNFVGREDGRFQTLDIGQTTAPNFNRLGEKHTFIFFADIPGLVNVRCKSAAQNGFPEGISLDTNPAFSVFSVTGSSNTDASRWMYYTHGQWENLPMANASSWSGGWEINSGTTRILRQYDALGRYGGGVFYFGGTKEGEYYPRSTGLGAGGLKYMGVWFGDGPLIYAPKIKR